MALVTVSGESPATCGWPGSVRGRSGDIPNLYRKCGIEADAILDVGAQASVG
jgi:hypothetical protein